MSRECDKLESDDFENEMKYEFELICKAFNESKMLWLVLLLMDYSLPQVYGRTERTMGWKDLEGKRRVGGDKRSTNQVLAEGGMWNFKRGALPGNLLED